MYLTGLINGLLARNQAFVSYRLPGAIEPVTLLGGTFKTSSNWHSLQNKTGFFVAPFVLTEQSPYLFYDNGRELKGWQFNLSLEELEHKSLSGKRKKFPAEEVDFKQYKRQADRLVKLLRTGNLTKVVLSRVLVESLPEGFSAGSFFFELCKNYPMAFVYLFNDGFGGFWAGATPETLLDLKNQKASTMSLAGTLPAKKGGSAEKEWQEKELEEQKLVTQFVRDKLINNGIQEFIEAPLEVMEAGPVVHLLKRFDFDLPENISALELAISLHPTPAVCGLPPQLALNQILKTETHQRAYYAGFIGPVFNQHHARFFVNLRCMQVIEKNALIFAGGGLLAESDVEREWQETALKAETLLSVIRKFD
jgi:isochorismate synthase